MKHEKCCLEDVNDSIAPIHLIEGIMDQHKYIHNQKIMLPHSRG